MYHELLETSVDINRFRLKRISNTIITKPVVITIPVGIINWKCNKTENVIKLYILLTFNKGDNIQLITADSCNMYPELVHTLVDINRF